MKGVRRCFNGVVALFELLIIRVLFFIRESSVAHPANIKRILVFGYMGIGDLLMFSPALQAVKKELPWSHMTLLTGPYSGAKGLVEGLPFIDEVCEVDWMNASFIEHFKINWTLNKKNFDVLLATYTAPVRFFLWGTHRIPIRLGMCRQIKFPLNIRRPWSAFRMWFELEFLQEEFFRRYLFNYRVYINQDPIHEIDKGLKLLEGLFPNKSFDRQPSLVVSDKNQIWASQFLVGLAVHQEDKLIAIHPASSLGQKWKQWPLDRYVELCRSLLTHPEVKILLLGTKEEGLEIRGKFEIFETDRVIFALGQTTPLQAAALIKKCHNFVGGDSGLGHLAIAVGTPSIRIFGPSDLPGYSKWREGDHLDIAVDLNCRPCLVSGVFRPGQLNYLCCPHINCLNHIDVQTVYAHVLTYLNRVDRKSVV